MKYPINYQFVVAEKLPICTDHGTQERTVLVLDVAGNDAYWKTIYSIKEFIKQQKLNDPSQAKRWVISSAFARDEGFIDLMEDQPWLDEDTPLLYSIPVDYTEDERPFCFLELADGTVVENQLWK